MAKTKAAQAKQDARAQRVAWQAHWNTAPTVLHVETGAQRTYSGISPFQAVMAAYAQARHDWDTSAYAQRYGALVTRTTHGVVCGDWWAYHPATRLTRAHTRAAMEAAMDEATQSATCDTVEGADMHESMLS